MQNLKRSLAVLLIGGSLIIFSGCNTGQKNQKDGNDASEMKEEVVTKIREEQKQLIQKANEQLAAINKKVQELNKKIEEQSEPLSDKQNEALDALQNKREEVNQGLNKIKSVSVDEWDDFKTTFEEDLDSVIIIVDDILSDF